MRTEESVALLVVASSLLSLMRFVGSEVLPEEVEALQQIASTMGSKYWKFNGHSCQLEMVGVTRHPPLLAEKRIDCDCYIENNRKACHVVRIVLKRYNLPGVLPTEIVKLPHLREIDFAYNFLYGSIPSEWNLTQLTSISVLANRLSGEIPKALADVKNLTYLSLEANQFSGSIPSEIGSLVNLSTLILSSNLLTGELPMALAGLRNLRDFRISDNNFHGAIPEFILDWKLLTRLEMQASGLDGPIPSNISTLEKLTSLRISDISGTTQAFPMLSNINDLVIIILRNCSISGEIPPYVWGMNSLVMLDVSFNKLAGEIPEVIRAKNLKFSFLSGNMLAGSVPESILRKGNSVDLSYNNFTWQGQGQPFCNKNMNLNLNLFRSSMENSIRGVLPCSEDVVCPRYQCSSHVNCGGDNLAVKDSTGKAVYEGDFAVEGGTANYYLSNNYWGFSSTGDFMDDNDFQNKRYTASLSSANIPELYTTARISPLSLTYFYYCLENGSYTVNLHFAEIQFTSDNTYNSLGRRFFDIYIQEKLVWKDFNPEDAAQGAQKPVVKKFNVGVTNNFLEIRFQWAGRGTTRIPDSGVYGPLISAISVYPNFKSCSRHGRKMSTYIIIVSIILGLILFSLSILWWKRRQGGAPWTWAGLKSLNSQTGLFTLRQIKDATNNFDSGNKVGEGGFGPVFKGVLSDGSTIAVKQLSSKSRQGNREFLNEIGMISCLQHPNLVKLHGCCIEAGQLLLVYEYMENNSLAQALFGPESCQLMLDWPTRQKISIGIARGLAFLHEESSLKIVHRDIKATNVLLDKDLNPKISDFGMARLDEDGKTHISTRVAGTVGYMAPEYALWGYLTYKADVYSFGVVILEIVSGKSNNSFMPSDGSICLLEWACSMQSSGKLMELIDQRLGSSIDKEEAERVIKVALVCTTSTPTLRPSMSEVVSMLEGKTPVPDVSSELRSTEDLRFRAMRDYHQKQKQDSIGFQMPNSSIDEGAGSSLTSSNVIGC